jgi:hypothetical protein
MRDTSKMAAAALFGAALASSAPATAAQIVNGGFETGTLAGWTRSGASAFSGVNKVKPNSGEYAAFFSPNQVGSIAQTINTFVGSPYRIKFFLAHEVGQAAAINSFSFSFGGVSLGTFSNFTNYPYTQISIDRVATAPTATLKFDFRDARPTRFFIDDISVTRLVKIGNVLTPVPEPASWAMLLVGFALTGLAMPRSPRSLPVVTA